MATLDKISSPMIAGMTYDPITAMEFGESPEDVVIDIEALKALTDAELEAMSPEELDAICAILDAQPRSPREVAMDREWGDAAKEHPKEGEERKPVSLRVKVTKIAPDQRLVFGWLSVAAQADGTLVIDHEGHTIDPTDLESAVYGFVLDSRKMGELHETISGRLVESVIFTEEKIAKMGIPRGVLPLGWWVGFYVENDSAWEKIKRGEYKAFSIGGSARPDDGEGS